MRRSRFEWRGSGAGTLPASGLAPVRSPLRSRRFGANGGAARRPRRNGGQLV